MAHRRRETHYINRIGWLRAAVLGANDGILSTASLIIGVAGASSNTRTLLITGVAGLVAGSMSMAAGEYVSVSSQADTEKADLELEREELADDPAGERRELVDIYVNRGLSAALAAQVVEQLTAKDALSAHARDELGLSEVAQAHPVQAAGASAASFASGAFLPLLATALSPPAFAPVAVALASLLALAILGLVGARAGGADPVKAVVRVVFWGVIAMAVTFGIGRLFGARL